MKRFLFALVAMSLLFTACEDDGFGKLTEVDDVCTMMDDLELMEYCYEKFDVNKDGKVSMSEAAAVYSIDTYDYIRSIKGIEYFPNLEILDIEVHSSFTDCNLMNNKKLKSITIGNWYSINISDLNFSKLTNLSFICLDNIAIKDLNLSNGNDIELNLLWDCDSTPPACTIWLKSGQKLKSYIDKKYNCNIEYID